MSPLLELGRRPKRIDFARTAVTYRHVLTPQAMTVTRVIAHCDIDAAYAQFEMVRLGIPADQPVCVQQWTGLIAVNYPARKYGITRHMDVHEARKKCPNLQTIHVATYREGDTEPGYWGDGDPKVHKVSLDPYRRESTKILAVFKRLVPDGEVEKASIDEAYIDLTALVIKEILNRHGHISSLPADAPFGLDTPLPPPPPIVWDPISNIFPIRGDAPQPEDGNGDGYDGPEEEEMGGWEDYALSIGAVLIGEIRAEVKRELGYTCSAGVAHNKTIAKLCSAWRKPDAQTVMRQAAVPAFLNPMQFTKIRFLGGKLGDAMAKEYEANTVGDMLAVSLEEMQRKFGEESIWVYNILRGVDHNPVVEKTATKSMLASKNVQPSITTREGGYHWLNILAGELYVRLRDAREITDGLWPKTITLTTRQVSEQSRTRQAAFPYTRNLSTDYISKYARRLWDEVSEPMTRQLESKSAAMRISSLGLSFSGLERLEGGQKGIEGFFKSGATPTHGRKRSRSRSLQDEPGPSVDKTSGYRHEFQKGTSLPTTPQSVSPEIIEVLDDSDGETDAVTRPMFFCKRCDRTIRSVRQIEVKEDNDMATEALRQEHDDYHIARDLHKKDMDGSGRQSHDSITRPAKRKKATIKKPEGIRAFFVSKEPAASSSKRK